jgi:lipid-A-disaccharide synthase
VSDPSEASGTAAARGSSTRQTGRRIMISCGEASGDLYAGALVAAMRAIDPSIHVSGFGGRRLREAGATLIGDYRGVSVTGLTEALAVLPRSYAMLRRLRRAAARTRPDVFVAIDFPDFNFRLLPHMRRLGTHIVYYVSPQIWAWRASRLETLRRFVDRMLVIFPFEAPFYEKANVPVEFVGHPLIDLVKVTRPRDQWLPALGLDPARPVVALLPGSRPNELRHILPVVADAARFIARQVPGTQFLVARAPALADELFGPLDALRHAGIPLAVVEDATDDALAAADVVVTASGTATVQTALHGTPMVIVYRLSNFTYALARRFVRVGTYGMVNLVAGRTIVPELIQDALTPDAVAREVVSLLNDRGRREAMRRDLADVRSRLGEPGASVRAARAVLD